MPDAKEKLVELLDEADEWADHKCDELECETCPADKMKGNCIQQLMVDRLIAHGVTVQEWISVKDRLPEPFVSVLACIPSEAPLPTVHESYIADHGAWVCILTAERYKPGEVTHWKPMPQPPKGE